MRGLRVPPRPGGYRPGSESNPAWETRSPRHMRIRLLLRVAAEKRLPFAVQVPNATTVMAMKELDEGKGQRFGSVEELFRDLDL